MNIKFLKYVHVILTSNTWHLFNSLYTLLLKNNQNAVTFHIYFLAKQWFAPLFRRRRACKVME